MSSKHCSCPFISNGGEKGSVVGGMIRPPLGLKSREQFIFGRIRDIVDSMKRYRGSCKTAPEVWYRELNGLSYELWKLQP